MLAQIRRFLNTRAARLFFVVLIVPFVMWGVADVARNFGSGTSLATVGSRKIEPPEFQEAYRQQMQQAIRMMGGKAEPTPAIRRGVAGQTMERLVIQAAIANEVQRLGIAVPDEAVRQAVFDIPAFRGKSGSFDRQQFEQVLRQNNLNEPRFLELMRSDLGQRQLMEAVQAGGEAPQTLLKQVFAFQREQRVAELVELPFSAVPEPTAPTADELRRAYDDDPQRYSAPAYRRIKAVVLSPDTVARGIEIPDADLQAYYEAHKAEFGGPEKRTVQVVVAQDEAAAKKLADVWIAGADWTVVQADASAAGASAAQIDDAARTDIPGDELAEAAFRAPAETVTGPIKSPFGWQVLRVGKITPGNERPFEAVRDDIHGRVARERAVDEVYARANKLEDALSAGTALDDLPGDLGVAGIAGTLDDKGNTPDGEPAPIPGSPALRQAIITSAFATPKGQPPTMIEGPDQSYYALVVEDTTAPAVRPFEAVEAQLRDNFEHDARRRAQETVAAKLLTAAKAGSLDDAATVAGVRAERTPPVGRSSPVEGVPAELIQPLFGMKLNDATMLETPSGFLVAKLVEVQSPDPQTDPAGAAQMRTALSRSIDQDMEITYAAALRDRVKPTVNQAMLESLIQ
jgi:peptidyl-prolyl cis-trans isomerase D